MELLGRIIPAIRETRIPLVSGYVWLLAIWLGLNEWTDVLVALTQDPPQGSILWAFTLAFGPASGIGTGLAVTFVAFMVGSTTGYVWDLFLRPLDERALRDRAAQQFAEAQLRFQIALPLAALVPLVISDRWVLVGVLVPVLLVAHGRALWKEARSLPLRADLTGVDLSNAYLRNANCAHVDMAGANLQGADLTAARFDVTNLLDAQLTDADLTGVDLTKTNGLTTNQIRAAKTLERVVLSKARLAKVVLSKADLSWANLSRADLTGADLSEARLTWARLTSADLSRAILIGARLTSADLSGAVLSGADLSGVTLSGADLSGADLLGADLTGVRWSDEYPPKWPSGFDPPDRS